jgi:tRNA modification GTPase
MVPSRRGTVEWRSRGELRYTPRMASSEAATIFAPATAPGKAALAVIRISGSRAGSALDALLGERPRPAPRRAVPARLVDPASGGAIDDALVLWFPGPRSFTGEDVVELQLHGGRAVLASAIQALAAMPGLRPARPGEFARRAFDRGKLDLSQIEAIADLVAAETAAQARQALRQLEGALGRQCEAWRSRILRAQARVEAEIDFPDEDLPADLGAGVNAELAALAGEIDACLADGRRGERLREGFVVAILGPPNAGKSSLLNAIAGREAAIVAPSAGTTRDIVEVALDLQGWPVVLLDTAGLRETAAGDPDGHGAIEAEGIRRAIARAAQADLKLVVVEAREDARALADPLIARLRDERSLVVRNKIDLGAGTLRDFDAVDVSAQTGHGLDRLLDAVTQCCAKEFGDVGRSASTLTRARHRESLLQAHAALQRAANISAADEKAEELRAAAKAIGQITGHAGVENMLDLLFAEFCIGK